MTTRVGVVVFPGTNCEHDVVQAVDRLGGQAELLWHAATSLGAFDAVILPGGFAHGDYLRPGALACFSPIMDSVRRFAEDGGPVVGICNGFQVLTEAGMLPGALQKNKGLRFICAPVEVEVCSDRSALTSGVEVGRTLRIPINHFEGSYTCDPRTLAELQSEGRVVLRYRKNPNGSVDDIAGIANPGGNVIGLMPHPERASDDIVGSSDGNVLLGAFLRWAARRALEPAQVLGVLEMPARSSTGTDTPTARQAL
jgi:phosphoribosylformylglycinamidine synthase subunit PurQ / glutaminase